MRLSSSKRGPIEKLLLAGGAVFAALASAGMLRDQPAAMLLLVPMAWCCYAAGYWRAM